MVASFWLDGRIRTSGCRRGAQRRQEQRHWKTFRRAPSGEESSESAGRSLRRCRENQKVSRLSSPSSCLLVISFRLVILLDFRLLVSSKSDQYSIPYYIPSGSWAGLLVGKDLKQPIPSRSSVVTFVTRDRRKEGSGHWNLVIKFRHPLAGPRTLETPLVDGRGRGPRSRRNMRAGNNRWWWAAMAGSTAQVSCVGTLLVFTFLSFFLSQLSKPRPFPFLYNANVWFDRALNLGRNL